METNVIPEDRLVPVSSSYSIVNDPNPQKKNKNKCQQNLKPVKSKVH